MPNYFDYMLKASDDYNDITDWGDSLFSEMDLTLAEFDNYVQEGVGVKILIGIGLAAALGGLIALIIKLFSGKSGGTSASTKTKAAKTTVNQAKKAGVETLKVNITVPKEGPKPSGDKAVETSQKHVETIVETVNQYNNFVEKYFDNITSAIEKGVSQFGTDLDKLSKQDLAKFEKYMDDMKSDLFDSALNDFPILKKLLGSKTNIGAKATAIKVMSGDEKTATKVAKNVLEYVSADLDINEVASFIDNTMKQCKTLLLDGKKLSKHGERLKALAKKTGDEEFIKNCTSETFDKITAMISNELNEAYSFIAENMDEIRKACKAALDDLNNGKSLDEAMGDGKFEKIGDQGQRVASNTMSMLNSIRGSTS